MSFKSADSWTILSPIEQRIKQKIEAVGTPLKDWDIQINYGIKTGYNEAFIIDGKKKDELIAKDPKSAEIIRPILRGRDIKRYGYDFADLWILYIPWHFPLHNNPEITGASKEAEDAFEEQYPAIYQHLLSHKDKLSARNKEETGIRYEWYAMQRWGANYWEDFSRQVIAWQRITAKNQFTITSDGMVILDSMAFLSNTDQYKELLLAVLNSKVVYFWIKCNVHEYGDSGFRLSNQYVEQIPIPKIIDNLLLQNIKELVRKMLVKNEGNSYYSSIELEINKLIYLLYELDSESISHIEGL